MLSRLLALLLGLAIFVAAFFLSVVIFALIAAAALVVFAFAWWRLKFGARRSNARRGGEIIDVPSREVARQVQARDARPLGAQPGAGQPPDDTSHR